MKKAIYPALAFGLIALVLSGCGEHKSYTLSYNKCETGTHGFDSLKEYCEGLQDNALNNHCALGMRENRFKQDGCEGEFRPH